MPKAAISVIGAEDSLVFLPWAYRKIVLPLFMRWFQAIIDDKNRMESMIKKSGLDWTIRQFITPLSDFPSGSGVMSSSLAGK